jgi:PHD/YefM family antitoxin component YafN of YafNO toxin-antitoxin module
MNDITQSAGAQLPTCPSHEISCKLADMIELANVHALSDFQRNAKKHIRRLKASGKPAVLTVNGQAEIVIQSAESYQKLLRDQELLESLRSISRGLEQAKRGEGRPMRQFLEELAKEHGIALK